MTVPESRFHLYQMKEMRGPLATMWILFDEPKNSQHYLCGEGWEGAQSAAEGRITEILAKD